MSSKNIGAAIAFSIAATTANAKSPTYEDLTSPIVPQVASYTVERAREICALNASEHLGLCNELKRYDVKTDDNPPVFPPEEAREQEDGASFLDEYSREIGGAVGAIALGGLGLAAYRRRKKSKDGGPEELMVLNQFPKTPVVNREKEAAQARMKLLQDLHGNIQKHTGDRQQVLIAKFRTQSALVLKADSPHSEDDRRRVSAWLQDADSYRPEMVTSTIANGVTQDAEGPV